MKHVHRVHSWREGDISSHSSLYTIVPTKIIFYKMGSSYKSTKITKYFVGTCSSLHNTLQGNRARG